MTGFPDGPPVRGGGALADFVGGLYLALGVVAALLERERDGPARVLDLSNQDAVFAITDSAATIFAGHRRAERSASAISTPSPRPTTRFAARDGYVVDRDREQQALPARSARRSGAPSSRPTSASVATAGARRAARRSTPWWRPGSPSGAATRCSPRSARAGARLPCARVAAPEELLDDPQLVARGMIERHPHPTLGEVVFHGNPLQLRGRRAARARARARPRRRQRRGVRRARARPRGPHPARRRRRDLGVSPSRRGGGGGGAAARAGRSIGRRSGR